MENKPVSITGGASFVYDGDGNRVKKTEGGETTLYINKYYEKNLTTSVVTTSYYLGDKLIAQREATTLRYVHQDSLSGTSVMSNSSGGSVGSILYYPYGATRAGSVPTDKLFTGQRLDDTGLYYYGARYYDSTIGRFISPDSLVPNWMNPQSLNRYSYCINNPLKYIDPSGHDEKDPPAYSSYSSNPYLNPYAYTGNETLLGYDVNLSQLFPGAGMMTVWYPQSQLPSVGNTFFWQNSTQIGVHVTIPEKSWSVGKPGGALLSCASVETVGQGKITMQVHAEFRNGSSTVSLSVWQYTKWVDEDIVASPGARITLNKGGTKSLGLDEIGPGRHLGRFVTIAGETTQWQGSTIVSVPQQATKVELRVNMSGAYHGGDPSELPNLAAVPREWVINLYTGRCSTKNF